MESIHFVVRILAVSQILLIFMYLMLYQRNTNGYLLALVLFSFGCYLVAPFTDRFTILHQFIFFISSTIPASLWILGRYFFYDERKIPWGFWMLTSIYLLLWIPNWESYSIVTDAQLAHLIFDTLPQLLKLGLVVHVFYMALEGRAADLVQRRLKLRVPFAAGGAALASLVILVEIWSAGPPALIIEAAGSILMLIVSLGANLYLFSLRDDLPITLEKRRVNSVNPDRVKDNTIEIEQIQTAMAEGRFYAVHGATIGDLSNQLGIAEYRMRAMINKELGYQNFNQFLNKYRIDEASERLLSERQLPILSIALDIGFKSLSSFNKAFKDTHSKTPSEFRNQT